MGPLERELSERDMVLDHEGRSPSSHKQEGLRWADNRKHRAGGFLVERQAYWVGRVD